MYVFLVADFFFIEDTDIEEKEKIPVVTVKPVFIYKANKWTVTETSSLSIYYIVLIVDISGVYACN